MKFDVSTPRTQHQPHGAQPPSSASRWAGWIFFAGFMMLMLGILHAISGLVALLQDDFYLVSNDGLVITLSYTAWGWIHLGLGLLVAFGGLAVVNGRPWGRTVGVFFASLSALISMTFLPAYPFWSLIIIAVAVVVIYALTVHGDEVLL